jgi:hypothetical protein
MENLNECGGGSKFLEITTLTGTQKRAFSHIRIKNTQQSGI